MNQQMEPAASPALLSSDPLVMLCRTLPGVTEDVKWEDRLAFSIGGKMFVMFKLPAADSFDFKADPVTFSLLSAQPAFSPAPYLARADWLRLHDRAALDHASSAQLLQDAYQIVHAKLTKKVRQQIKQAGEPPGNRYGEVARGRPVAQPGGRRRVHGKTNRLDDPR